MYTGLHVYGNGALWIHTEKEVFLQYMNTFLSGSIKVVTIFYL